MIMKKYYRLGIAIMGPLILVNNFAENLSHIFSEIERRSTFYIVFSVITVIMSVLTFYVFGNIEKKYKKISICITGAFLIPCLSFVLLHIINMGLENITSRIFSELKVLIGLAIGYFVIWAPIALIWYFTFEGHNKRKER